MTIPLEHAIDQSRERLVCFRCHTILPNDVIIVDYRASKIMYSCRCGNRGWRSFGAIFTTVSITDIVVYIDCPIRTENVRRVTRPLDNTEREEFRARMWDHITDAVERNFANAPAPPSAEVARVTETGRQLIEAVRPLTMDQVINIDTEALRRRPPPIFRPAPLTLVDAARRSIAHQDQSPPPVAEIDCDAAERIRHDRHPLDALFADVTPPTIQKKPRNDGYDIADDPNSEE